MHDQLTSISDPIDCGGEKGDAKSMTFVCSVENLINIVFLLHQL